MSSGKTSPRLTINYIYVHINLRVRCDTAVHGHWYVVDSWA